MRRLHPPEKSAILELPPFAGLGLESVRVAHTQADLADAWQDLNTQAFIGFDTETRPCFQAGLTPRGPDVVQFATGRAAYVLQMHREDHRDLARRVLQAPVVKTGFGVAQDQAALERLLGQCAQPLLDLDEVFHRQGYNASLGIKAAVAVVFGQRFIKSKRVTTSNWSLRQLEPRQLLYAANDAHVALRVLQALDLPAERLPVWNSGYPPPVTPRR